MRARALLSGVAIAWVAAAAPLVAQQAKDLALVQRILAAEDRRDASDTTLTIGAGHPDAMIRQVARRAQARIADSLVATRSTFPTAVAPPHYPDPAWRLRHRALGTRGVRCEAVRAGLADSAWPVRFRAAGVLAPSCANAGTMATLTRWADALPRTETLRPTGGVSWHGAVHALQALARLAPREAAKRLEAFASHPTWQVRRYAVQAASTLGDTLQLRAAVTDSHPNVRAAAITALRTSTDPRDRGRFVAALRRTDVPTVLAAAGALADAPEPEARRAATAAWRRWVARASASERDVRVALLAVTGRPASDDIPPPDTTQVPAEAAALALGAERFLRVTMASGGYFVVRLRGDVAPIMAARVLTLVRSGHYDGLTWHRVEHDFVIQGGSPAEDEYVGSPQYFRDELGTVPHARGTVGMSTRGHDTGDAQWFINLRDNLRLNRDYTVFGEVVEGIAVVDAVLEGDVIASMQVVPGR